MRTKTIVQGLKNSQRIRVILQGVGFHTTIQGVVDNMSYTDQIVAVLEAIQEIADTEGGITGFGSNINGYDIQVDLV
jgi:hypothetical protein